MRVARKVIEFPEQSRRRHGYETAFLPAALEVIETPPSPVGRAIIMVVILLFCSALAWASLGRVDIVTTAPGKIVLNGRTKVIQAAETGLVRAVHVHDGSMVKAGDLLIELDPTINAAELDHVRGDLIAARLEIARLRAALASDDQAPAMFAPPKEASAELVEMNRQLLASQMAEHAAKLAEIDRKLSQKRAERETIAATIAKLDATIPLLQQRVDIRKYLFDNAIGTKLSYLSDAQELVGQQHDVVVQQSRLREAEAAMAELAQTRLKADADFRRGLYEDLAKAKQHAAGLAQDVIKGEQKAKQQLLTAPVDGVVQELSVHTIGGVVMPAQPLASVVSLDRNLEIEAMIQNSDIGFVAGGQTAAIKVDTFNFTRYGLLRGTVLSVSHDAIARDERADRPIPPSGAAESGSSPRASQGSVYAARVSLDRNDMVIDGRPVQLLPGMAVTVEIKTGSRRIIGYLLSPLLRHRQEMLRER